MRKNDERHSFRRRRMLLWLLLLGTGVFNVADYALTLHALGVGFREGNPFVALIVDTPFFAKLKLLIVPLMLIYLWHKSKKLGDRIYPYAWTIFIAYGALMVYYAQLFWRGYL